MLNEAIDLLYTQFSWKSLLRIFINLFIYYFWLCWVLISVRGLSPVAASGGHSSSRCAGLSLSRPLLLRSTGCKRAGSVVVARGPSCSAACEILPDQGSNPCPLHWQADSQPLHHQGSPLLKILILAFSQWKRSIARIATKYIAVSWLHYFKYQSEFFQLAFALFQISCDTQRLSLSLLWLHSLSFI